MIKYIGIVAMIVMCSCGNSNKKQKYMGLHGEVISIFDKKYDAKEKFKEIIKDDKIDEATEYRFNDNGNLAKIIYYSSDGTPLITIEQEYDNNSNLLKSYKYVTYSSEDKKRDEEITELINTYDNCRVLVRYYNESKDEKDTIIENRNKNVINTEVIRYDKTKIKSSSDLDRNSNIVSYKSFYNEELNSEGYIQYEGNDMIEHIVKLPLNPDREQIIYTYKYPKRDEKENWVEKVEYKDGVAVSLIERKIEYK